jgi:hypothetical protein
MGAVAPRSVEGGGDVPPCLVGLLTQVLLMGLLLLEVLKGLPCALFKLPLLRPQLLRLFLPVEFLDSALLLQLCLLLLEDFLLPYLLLLLYCLPSRLLCMRLEGAVHLLLVRAPLLLQLSGLILQTLRLYLLVLLVSASILLKFLPLVLQSLSLGSLLFALLQETALLLQVVMLLLTLLLPEGMVPLAVCLLLLCALLLQLRGWLRRLPGRSAQSHRRCWRLHRRGGRRSGGGLCWHVVGRLL